MNDTLVFLQWIDSSQACRRRDSENPKKVNTFNIGISFKKTHLQTHVRVKEQETLNIAWEDGRALSSSRWVGFLIS